MLANIQQSNIVSASGEVVVISIISLRQTMYALTMTQFKKRHILYMYSVTYASFNLLGTEKIHSRLFTDYNFHIQFQLKIVPSFLWEIKSFFDLFYQYELTIWGYICLAKPIQI